MSASSKRPSRRSAAPVNAPFSWPNSSLSSSVSGSAPTLTAMNGLSRRGLSDVNRARDELLARAALAFDQHGARHRRHLLDLHHHLAHRVALADQARDLLQRAALENAAKAADDFVDVHRLREKVDVARAREGARRARGRRCRRGRRSAAPFQSCSLTIAMVDGSVEIAGEDDDVGLLALDRGANVVERGDERGVDAVLLEEGVDADGGFDVLEREKTFIA